MTGVGRELDEKDIRGQVGELALVMVGIDLGMVWLGIGKISLGILDDTPLCFRVWVALLA
jgi:hypothetical protein